ncbi:hypothetical protein D081_0452 [Anaerovibrio sp. JC8]|uniref:hypothetical protein n=1 Tax=Anaerovibrio sp. JC8 TaxID=1240085 RepID=UPI000A0AC3E6|nr:hypothetical protein [Anaerovibrio sp. JC8]ORU01004.1 hypothetical protein D081_0452 [Anaerovibrio sp. JC8]
MNGNVYVVHCIDTEGPLNESITATFDRVYGLTGIRLKPSYETLEKIQRKEIDLGGFEEVASYVFSKRFQSYCRTWYEVEDMLSDLTSDGFRKKYKDSYGNGWTYSWFIVDLADFVTNPRDRALGYHNVWDHYKQFYALHDIEYDEFQWHAHPMSTYGEANRCATSYINSPHILQSLARRLIDKGFFPNCFRPGYHTERPDSHWLLEQYIPFDYANQAVEFTEYDREQGGIADGRNGDWRRAPSTWEPYHPSHDDYQVPGDCRRTIFRCLNVGTRMRCMTQDEVDKAFARADAGEDTIIAFADHDFRDMRPDIEDMYDMLKSAEKRFPNVKWVNAKASEAAKKVLKLSDTPIHLNTEVKRYKGKCILVVETDQDSFGPQPFLAFKLRGGRYYLDNFDFQEPRRKWTYTFDADTIHEEDVEAIGIATNSLVGTGALKVITLNNVILKERMW